MNGNLRGEFKRTPQGSKFSSKRESHQNKYMGGHRRNYSMKNQSKRK